MINNCSRLLTAIGLMLLAACGAGTKSGEPLLQPQKIYFEDYGPLMHPWGTPGIINHAKGGDGSGVITYRSSDEEIAQVDEFSGALTLLTVGTVTITANKPADERFASAETHYTLYVTHQPRQLVFQQPGDIALTATQGLFENPIVEPAGLSVEYESTNTAVASSLGNGALQINGIGTTAIIARVKADDRYASAEAQYTLTVGKLPQALSFADPGPITKTVKNLPFSNLASGGSGSGVVSYTSSNNTVATVDRNSGEVTLVGEGNCVISATIAADDTYAQASASYTLKVDAGDPALWFDEPSEWNAFVGETFTNVAHSNFGSRVVSYSSNNTAVATVDPVSGKVRAVSPGLAYITASQLHLSISYLLRIAPNANVTAVSWIGENSLTLEFNNADILQDNQPVGLALRYATNCTTPYQPCAGASTLIVDQPFVTAAIPRIPAMPMQLEFGNRNSNVFISSAQPVGTGGGNVVEFNKQLWRLGGISPPGLWVSTDGSNWQERTPSNLEAAPLFYRIHSHLVSFNNRLWLLGGAEYDDVSQTFIPHTDVWNSVDGKYWQLVSTSGLPGVTGANAANTAAFTNGGKLWFKVGYELWSSINGTSWQQVAGNLGWSWTRFVVFNGVIWTWNNKQLSYSETGKIWSPKAFPAGTLYVSAMAVYDSRLWLLTDKSLYYSTDGNSFTEVSQTLPFNGRHHALLQKFNNRLWLVGGYFSSDVWSTSNGLDWRIERGANSYEGSFSAETRLRVAIDDNTLFAVAGNRVWRLDSPSLAWLPQQDSLRSANAATDLISFDNALWKAKPSLSSDPNNPLPITYVLRSVDGNNWSEQAQLSGSYQHLLLQNGVMYLFNGNLADGFLSSGDGISWTPSTPLAANETATTEIASHIVANDSEFFALANNKLYRSSDGRVWTAQTIDSQFLPANFLQLTTLHLLGTTFWLTGTNTDGKGFALRSDNALASWGRYEPRDLPAVDCAIVEFNGRTWLFGGYALRQDPRSGFYFRSVNDKPWIFEGGEWRQGQLLHFRFNP